MRLVDTIFRRALALPPDPIREPEVRPELAAVVRFLNDVCDEKVGTRADAALVAFLIQTARNNNYR